VVVNVVIVENVTIVISITTNKVIQYLEQLNKLNLRKILCHLSVASG